MSLIQLTFCKKVSLFSNSCNTPQKDFLSISLQLDLPFYKHKYLNVFRLFCKAWKPDYIKYLVYVLKAFSSRRNPVDSLSWFSLVNYSASEREEGNSLRKVLIALLNSNSSNSKDLYKTHGFHPIHVKSFKLPGMENIVLTISKVCYIFSGLKTLKVNVFNWNS